MRTGRLAGARGAVEQALVGADPQAAVDPGAKVFDEVAVDSRLDLRAGGFLADGETGLDGLGVHRADGGNGEQGGGEQLHGGV